MQEHFIYLQNTRNLLVWVETFSCEKWSVPWEIFSPYPLMMSVSPWLAADIWNYGGSAGLMKGFFIQPCPYAASLSPPQLWVVWWPRWQSQERKYTLWYQRRLISGSLLISNYLIKGRWIICGPEFHTNRADLCGWDVHLSPPDCHWLALSCRIYFCRCDLHGKSRCHPGDAGRQSLSLPVRKPWLGLKHQEDRLTWARQLG